MSVTTETTSAESQSSDLKSEDSLSVDGIKLEEYESQAKDTSAKMAALEKALKEKTLECEQLKHQNSRLEMDVVESKMRSTQNATEASEVHNMKLQSEELLTRAKSMIFEKTKMNKNQELQIEALNAQVTSLKDVVAITKNLLEIRNMEVKHLQDQINCMNAKVDAEKERQNLVNSKLDSMIRMNGELKREYETQLCLFNALRERYSERELARNVAAQMVVAETARVAPPIAAAAPANAPPAEAGETSESGDAPSEPGS